MAAAKAAGGGGAEEPQVWDARVVLKELLPTVTSAIERWVPPDCATGSAQSGAGGADPRKTACDTVLESSGFAPNVPAVDGSLWEPVRYVLGAGGKRWRAVLALLVGELVAESSAAAASAAAAAPAGGVGGDDAKPASDEEAVSRFVEDVAALAEIVHNGTLVIDDVEDDSDVRRGQAALHVSHGVDVAVNAGNFMYYLPLAVLQYPRPGISDATRLRCFEYYARELTCVHAGQGIDIWWHGGARVVRESKQKQAAAAAAAAADGGGVAPEEKKVVVEEAEEAEPSIEHYLHMCANKTGSLARLAAKLAAVASGAKDSQVEAVGRFAETLGVAFQIQDDILNIHTGDAPGGTSQLAALKGGVGDDIHEGKRTIMVLHALENAPPADAARLRETLNAHTSDRDRITDAIAILEAAGSVTYAQQRARELLEQAWAEVDKEFTQNTRAKARLRSLAAFLIDRDI